ncbi:MAG TPA: lysine 5,6-aminomutase subunit alpha [Polyangiales bacterium]
MGLIALDQRLVDRCRGLASDISVEVQRFIDAHTSVGVERTVLRALGIEGVDAHGTPLVNTLVDRLARADLLGRGAAFFLGREMLRRRIPAQLAAEYLAYGEQAPQAGGDETRAQVAAVLADDTHVALARIRGARDARLSLRGSLTAAETPWKYVIVATGNINDDAVQARAAAEAGADVVAVIRATAQSLLDYVPHGATTEGFGGTYATQENFRIVRAALDDASRALGRYVMQTNYSSGLCMSEIAWMAAVERLDMLLNDSMYGILFRDINMRRTFVDQYFSRRIIGHAGIIINTGEDNYLTTADAVEAAHTVLASQFINEAFAHRAGLPDTLIGLGHAYEIDPWLPDSFVVELAQAQLIRQVFPRHPIKWMPPTKHKTGDIFQSHVHDALFTLVGAMTGQSIQLLGMFSEAIHNPLMMDRYLSLKATRYVLSAAKHLGDEISYRPDGRIAARAELVLRQAADLLEVVRSETLWGAIARGAFADVKREPTSGKGLSGVVARANDYYNPVLEQLEAA